MATADQNVRQGIGVVGNDFREMRNVLNANTTFTYQLAEQTKNIIADGGNSNPEIVAARTDYKGDTFATIGDRADAEKIENDSRYEQTNRQLLEKANTEYVESSISAVASGSPNGIYKTLADLQAAFPNGDSRTKIVEADGHWYYWASDKTWKSGGVYQSQGLADSSVGVEELSDDIKSKGFPFDQHAKVSRVMRDAVLEIRMFNADPKKQYTLASLSRNIPANGNWILNIYEWSNGNFGEKVCEWRPLSYTPAGVIEIIKLTSTSSSGIYAEIIIDWSKVPDQTQITGNTFQEAGIHVLAYTGKIDLYKTIDDSISRDVITKGYPFKAEVAPPAVIKNSVLDVKIYNADNSIDYVLAVFRKNIATTNNLWNMAIYEWKNGAFGNKVAEFIVNQYTPTNTKETILLSPVNGSHISVEMTIDWSKVPDGTSFTGQTYTAGGLHSLTYVGVEPKNTELNAALTSLADVNNIPDTYLFNNSSTMDQTNSSVSAISIEFKPQPVNFNIFEFPALQVDAADYVFCLIRVNGKITEKRLLSYEGPKTYSFVLGKSYNLQDRIQVTFGYCDENQNTVAQNALALASNTADANLLYSRIKYVDPGQNKSIYSETVFSGNANWKSANYVLKFLDYDLMNYDLPIAEEAPLKVLNMPKYREEKNIDETFFDNAYFMGRWTRRTVDGVDSMYTVNLGSVIFSKVENTSQVSIAFHDTNPSGNPVEIAYSVDGGEYIRDNVRNSPFIISDLDEKEHYIRIVVAGNKDTDAVWSGGQGIAFTGITVDEGGTAKPVAPKARIGEFDGDSITAGCWVLDRTLPSQGYAAEANYVEEACNRLRCSNVRVAFSSAGVTKSGAGGVPPFPGFIDNMDANTQEKSQTPDFVVVNMGTNDGAATSQEFIDAYQQSLNRLQQKYPGVEIFCMLPFNGVRKSEITSVVNNTINAEFVDTTGWGVTYIDGVHPDLNGSRIAGEKLADYLFKYFGKNFFTV